MKNVTVSLREETALWIRVRAAEENQSVSSWLGGLVEERRRQEDTYRLAMKRYLAAPPVALKRPGDRYPSREALHDRSGLR